MPSIAFSSGTARLHAPVVQRAAAIFAALGGGPDVRLRDIAEPAPTRDGGPCITLAHTDHDALTRDGERAWHIAYVDSASESVLAALIACASVQGMPIAADPESLSVIALAERLAASEIPVLVGGPTGTGKEVLSRFIHNRSPRANGPFIAVNCAAMPEAMLEAMLFGHVKGAFTGATSASEGFFRAADGGTLLLDEIAEMPIQLQAKLLRALQEGEVVPIGATRPIPVDVRIIAAANRDLPTEVATGRFRADLYYRLNVFPLALRPLRERTEDIAPLAFAMVLRHATAGRPVPWIGEAAIEVLRGHGWPGNVRELENVMRRALLLLEASPSGRPEITPAHIRFDDALRVVDERSMAAPVVPFPGGGQEPVAHGNRRLAGIVRQSEAQAIGAALAQSSGNRAAAARRLGISERTLRYRLAAFREAGIIVEPGAGAPRAAGGGVGR